MPADAFYYAFRMVTRRNEDYLTVDVLSDALGRDKSSRLYLSLKKDQNLVSNIGAYITGSIDEGLLVISGKLNNGVSFEDLDAALWKELSALTTELVPTNELERLKIKIQTSKEFNDQGLLNRAMNLSMHELLGGAEKINEESEIYQKITPEDIQRIARETLNKTNCSLLKVKADNAE